MIKNNFGKLKLEDVGLNIGDKVILRNINFEITTSKSLVVIGESGSGKTMLSKMIIGQLPDTAKCIGKADLNGVNLLSLSKNEFKKYRGNVIAYIAQNPMGLYNPMQTIACHAIELFKSNLHIDSKESLRLLVEGLKEFNFSKPNDVLDKYPFQLSGGMLQRIMFAMMLELHPQFLIADEPTSALDEYNTQTIVNSLHTCRENGIGIIVITHNYDIVKQFADDVIIIKNGEQIEYSSANQMLSNPKTEYSKRLLKPRIYTRYNEVKND